MAAKSLYCVVIFIFDLAFCLRNKAVAVNCWVIIHCLEVGCKGDQITSVKQVIYLLTGSTDRQAELLLDKCTGADLFRF